MIRTGFIGGSDAVKIMQGKWNELWHVKTGRTPSADLSHVLPVQLGIHTEDFNIGWFERQFDKKVISQQHEFHHLLKGVPLKGMIDGKVEGSNALVECKHTNSMTNMEKQIELYMPQIQMYMHLASTETQIEGCYMSIIFGNSKWESAYVNRNENYFNMMMDMIAGFWAYVESDEEPTDFDAEPTNIDHIEVNDMVKRDAGTDNAFINTANDYLDNKDQAKAFENAKKDLKAMVASNEREVYSPVLTIKRSRSGALLIKENKQ